MRETRRYSVYPSELLALAAFTALQDHMRQCGYEESQTACEKVAYRLRVDASRALETRAYQEFLTILSRHPHPQSVSAHSHWKTGMAGDLGCIVDLDPASLTVVVESSDLNILAGTHDAVRDLFSASNPPEDRSPRLRKWKLKKSIFLAHRFDDAGRASADTLARFLRRLGFDVAEGAGYEAREIPPKVEERIRAQDILLCVATAGDRHWILSEASGAKALGKYVIVLCAEGVVFNKGILGADFEYITFPTAFVEKAFSDLLYALPS